MKNRLSRREVLCDIGGFGGGWWDGNANLSEVVNPPCESTRGREVRLITDNLLGSALIALLPCVRLGALAPRSPSSGPPGNAAFPPGPLRLFAQRLFANAH